MRTFVAVLLGASSAVALIAAVSWLHRVDTGLWNAKRGGCAPSGEVRGSSVPVVPAQVAWACNDGKTHLR
jgi:hypothetical protein